MYNQSGYKQAAAQFNLLFTMIQKGASLFARQARPAWLTTPFSEQSVRAPKRLRAFHTSPCPAFRQSLPCRSSALTDAFQSLLPTLQAFPPALAPYLPGPLASYPVSCSLVLLTVSLRSAVTLPAALWQRARTRRMATEVVPVWEQMKKEIPLQVRARCRRAGKSYDEFRAELEAEMKKSLSDLLRKHRCTPLPTMLVPLAVQIPLFITLSYLIREAALTPQFAAELLPWSTWSFTGPSAAEQAQLDAFAQSASILRDRGMNEETLAQIMGPRGGGASGGGIGTTLAQKDTSMQGPIALGMITLLNAELNAYRSRRDRDQLKDDIPKQATSDDQSSPGNSQALPPRTVTRPTALIATRDYRPKAAQAQSSARSETPAPKPASSEDKAAVSPAKSAAEERTSLRTAIFTNTLRVAAIAFIPIASQVPGGLLVYWLSSAMYTMVQNGILDWREAKLSLPRSK